METKEKEFVPKGLEQDIPPEAVTPHSELPKLPQQNNLKKFFPLVLVIGAILFGIIVYMAMQKVIDPNTPNPIQNPDLSPTPSPTPIRHQTLVATSSGFLTMEEDISSLSAELQEFSKDDPALSPPNLVLPLGF